jgi:hypothetical protein
MFLQVTFSIHPSVRILGTLSSSMEEGLQNYEVKWIAICFLFESSHHGELPYEQATK